MTDLSEIKAELRRESFARRKSAHADAQGADLAIRDHFLASRYPTGARVITGYRPIRTEIDPTALMSALNGAGHRIAVPVILGAGLALEFREWWPGVEMTKGPFGAEVPVDTDVLVPDLLLVPLVAFDDAGWRLGYGGGFYDRSLEGLRAARKVRAVGVAYAGQHVETVPHEETDQPLDAILTEAGIIHTGLVRQ